jgi:hypothetical protein
MLASARPSALALMAVTGCLACSDRSGGDDAAPADAGPEALPDASGPPRLVHPMYSSGTRLKAVQMVGDDGTRRDWALQDTARGEPCWHMRAEDGKLRCLPVATMTAAFTDSACTQPIALSSTPCGQKYTRQPLAPTVGGQYRSRLRPVGEPIPRTPVFVSEIGFSGLTCKLMALQPEHQLFAVGEPLDPTAFVAVTEEDKLFGAELPVAGRYHVYEDGARTRVAATDSQLGGECHIRRAPDGSERCFPMGPGAGAFPGYAFADDACTVPLTMPVPLGQVVRFALESEYVRGGARLYRTVGTYQGPVFRGITGDCLPGEPPSEHQIAYRYSREDEVPTSSLGRVESWPAGGTRLRDEATIIVDGAVFPQTRWISTVYDPVHDQDCDFFPVADGGYRCVPRPGIREDLFADPACTTPVFVPDRRYFTDSVQAAVEPRIARHIVVAAPGASCGAAFQVYQVGAPAPQQYRKVGTTCQSHSVLSGYHLLGPPVDLNQFVKGQLETR